MRLTSSLFRFHADFLTCSRFPQCNFLLVNQSSYCALHLFVNQISTNILVQFRSGYINETLQFTKENSIVLWCRLCSSSTRMCFRRPLEREVGIPPELTILYLLFYVYIVILQGYGCCINLNLFFQLLSILNCFEANSKGISFTVVDHILYRLHYYVLTVNINRMDTWIGYIIIHLW